MGEMELSKKDSFNHRFQDDTDVEYVALDRAGTQGVSEENTPAVRGVGYYPIIRDLSFLNCRI
jgi:hypothetical protein